MSADRHGEQTGAVTNAFSKRVPSLASRSFTIELDRFNNLAILKALSVSPIFVTRLFSEVGMLLSLVES